MELKLQTQFSPFITTLKSRQDCNANALVYYPPPTASRKKPWRICSSSLVETAVSIAVAATAVGAATTLLVKRSKAEAAAKNEVPKVSCQVCGGSGICAECKGEGFVLKRLSDQSAEKARLMATNAATRYTAGLPKKWSYCTKCNAARSCISCGGTGYLNS